VRRGSAVVKDQPAPRMVAAGETAGDWGRAQQGGHLSAAVRARRPPRVMYYIRKYSIKLCEKIMRKEKNREKYCCFC